MKGKYKNERNNEMKSSTWETDGDLRGSKKRVCVSNHRTIRKRIQSFRSPKLVLMQFSKAMSTIDTRRGGGGDFGASLVNIFKYSY